MQCPVTIVPNSVSEQISRRALSFFQSALLLCSQRFYLKISEKLKNLSEANEVIVAPFQATNHMVVSGDALSRYCCHSNTTDVQHGEAILIKCWDEVLSVTSCSSGLLNWEHLTERSSEMGLFSTSFIHGAESWKTRYLLLDVQTNKGLLCQTQNLWKQL